MNEEILLRQLSRRARLESIPRVQVADRVMALIREEQSQGLAAPNPLAWVAGLAATAAVPMFFLGLSAWHTWTSPLMRAFVDVAQEGLL